MILDVTHAADESARQALDQFAGPVLASHQNCRALVPGERQFPDELLKILIRRGGVIGVSMDTWMLYKPGLDWGGPIPPRRTVFPRESITLHDVADHVDHLCQLAGNSLHAAIGGDTDGQGGCEGAPYEIDTVADYQKLAAVLDRRGYADADIANVMYRNWQRFYETWLPV
jgi:membrane dipeptidase